MKRKPLVRPDRIVGGGRKMLATLVKKVKGTKRTLEPVMITGPCQQVAELVVLAAKGRGPRYDLDISWQCEDPASEDAFLDALQLAGLQVPAKQRPVEQVAPPPADASAPVVE